MRFAVAACLLVACSDLQPVEPACGNGIVERGEDCDSGPNCRQCSIDCASDPCPVGYVCGPADKLCHAPGGRFHAQSAALDFPVLGFGVTDVNGDGFGDVVALSGTSLTVREGDAAGHLDRETSTLVPFLTGAPSVTHLDFDATLDLVLPTIDGLVAYTSPQQVMAPYPFPIDVSGSAQMMAKPVMTIPLDHQFLALLLRAGPQLLLGIIDGDSKDPTTALSPPVPICMGFTATDALAELADTYATKGATKTSVIIAARDPSQKLCMFELTAGAGTYAAREISTAIAIQAKPVLARLQAAGACPSLVDSLPSGLVEYAATGAPGTCDVAGAMRAIALPPLQAGQAAIGHLALEPPIAGAGSDALALNASIDAVPLGPSPTGIQLFASTRPIAAIHSLDVDGDGDQDAVASAGTFDDLDVLYRYGTDAGAGFLAVGLDTVGVPRHLVVGDFDGDGIGDITYSEKLGTAERLMIAFGSRDQVHAPVEVSRYHDILMTSPIDLATSSDPTGTVVRDLVVLDHVVDGILLTILFGSPQRTLVPFLDPRPASTMGSAGFRGAVTGTFGATPNGYQDLVGMESYQGHTRLWRFEPTSQGAMVTKASSESTAMGECTGDPTTDPTFCLSGAQYVPWRARSSDAADIALGVDGLPAHDVVAFDPAQIGGAFTASTVSLLGTGIVPEPGLAPIKTYVADIDGDGTAELLIGYGARDGSATGHVVACTAENLAISCHALEVPELAGWACVDAAPADVVEHQRFDALPDRTSVDLVVLCLKPGFAELFHVFHDDAGFHGAPLLALPPTVTSAQLADVTGDGIVDVLAVDRDPQNVVPLLRVYPQCTSREVESCAAPPAEVP